MGPGSGRGAFHGRYKPYRKERWWAMEVIMPVRVAIRRVRIPSAESLRFPVLCKSGQGQSGPKPRSMDVGDGQEVNIPPPPREVKRKGDAVSYACGSR